MLIKSSGTSVSYPIEYADWQCAYVRVDRLGRHQRDLER